MRIFSKISARLLNKNGVDKVKDALSKLREEVSSISPEGTVIVSVLDRGEGFYPANKLIKGLQELEYIYSPTAIQKNPELAVEYAEIGEHIKGLNKIISKRQNARQKARRERREKFQKRKEDNNEE